MIKIYVNIITNNFLLHSFHNKNDKLYRGSITDLIIDNPDKQQQNIKRRLEDL